MNIYTSLLLTLLGTVSAHALAARAACNADNCYRQVVANKAKPFHASALADCSSLLVATVKPCTTTSTVTASTVSVTAAGITPARKRSLGVVEKRLDCTPVTVAPMVPTYASSCANVAAYSSACSCGDGVTARTTTLTTDTVIVTSTPTATVVPVHRIVSPNNENSVGYRASGDSALVIGIFVSTVSHFFIDGNGQLREYESNLPILARDDSAASGPGVYQYFIGGTASDRVPTATVSGNKLYLSLGGDTDQFCYADDNGVLVQPETSSCRFDNAPLYVKWELDYVVAR